jgi:hypothetical protein
MPASRNNRRAARNTTPAELTEDVVTVTPELTEVADAPVTETPEPETPETAEVEETTAPDAPATPVEPEPETSAPEPVNADPEPEETGTDTPATEETEPASLEVIDYEIILEPAPVTDSNVTVTDGETPDLEPVTPDAPDADPVTEPEPPATEGDSPVTEPAPEPTPAELLQLAISPNPEVPLDTRVQAWTAAARRMQDGFLHYAANRPDDEPLLTDSLTLRISGANGRGVAAAKATLQVAQSLLSAGFYIGSTHDNTKVNNPMVVRVVAPRRFLPELELLLAALNTATGPIAVCESQVRTRQQNIQKTTGRPAGMTEYQFVNKPSRAAMEQLGAQIAVALMMSTPDKEYLTAIREVVHVNSMELMRLAPAKNVYPPTDRYAVKAETLATPAAQSEITAESLLASLRTPATA